MNAKIKIHNPRFYFDIMRGGSSALAESYIKNDFETLNLPSLIELTAKNINITHDFSGVLNISSLKNILESVNVRRIYNNRVKKNMKRKI